MPDQRIGIIGSGMLGGAIARALLRAGWPAGQLWLANRSGSRAGFEDAPDLTLTTDPQALADHCDLILLAVPPASFDDLGLHTRHALVVSVMAGITCRRIARQTGATRIVRAMSSPAAEDGLAFSPWFSDSALTASDAALLQVLLTACGTTDRLTSEDQIDLFTAMTGPVPGFVAFFAATMADYAVAQGIAPETADRAVRQLFLGAGQMMAAGAARPADHVQEMIDYAGTTAAGLISMQQSGIARDIAAGLDAAVARARKIGALD